MPARHAARHAARPLSATLLLAAALLWGCGGGGGSSPGASGASTDAQWVKDTMTDVYLYADRMPTATLTAQTTAAQALAALRVEPPDRFSYVDRASTYTSFFDDSRSLGLGIGYRVDGAGVVLRYVQPDSPAARAGLARGDRIVAIGGADVAALIAADTLSDAFGATEVGVAVRLAIDRAGARSEVTVTKDWYTVSPILATTVLTRGVTKVGYIALFTFNTPTRQAWADAIATIRAAGARSLVVDLRENGGGLLYVAADIAASLAPASAVGQPFTTLRHSARRADDDLTIAIPTNVAAGGFDQVAWLVSGSTCSASEFLIAGLRPYRDDPVIGTGTCGKPVGFEPRTRGDTVLSVVTFAGSSRDGAYDWFGGLAPTCTVSDERYVPYGDIRDPRLAEALVRLETGACSASAVGKSVVSPGFDRLPLEGGLAGQIGLR